MYILMYFTYSFTFTYNMSCLSQLYQAEGNSMTACYIFVCFREKKQDKMTNSKVDAKVVLLGKSYAGKTCLVERYLKNRFTGDSVPYQNV